MPDTNVCYPISLLDLFGRLDKASLHQILWTETAVNRSSQYLEE